MQLRLIGAAAAALAVPASASAATIRVEGATGAVIPETSITVPGSATADLTVRDTTDTDAVQVPAASATAQVARAATLFGIPLGFDIFDFGAGPASLITRIGPNAMPPSFTPSWRLKVNHKLTDTGADATPLVSGDRVLWSFAANFEAPDLDLRLPRHVLTAGQNVTARVDRYDNTGARTPAAGARVRFAATTVRTDSAGRANLSAARTGVFWVSASLPGAVRSQRELLCVQAPGPARPCSAVALPREGERVKRPAAITGVAAGPGRRVEVSLARLAGSACSFLGRDRQTFGPAGECRDRVAIPLALRPGRGWILEIAPNGGDAGLVPGRYRVWSRQVAGTRRESAATPGVNTVTFIVSGVTG